MRTVSLIKQMRYRLLACGGLILLLLGLMAFDAVNGHRKLQKLTAHFEVVALLYRVEVDLHLVQLHESDALAAIGDPIALSRAQARWHLASKKLGSIAALLRAHPDPLTTRMAPMLERLTTFSQQRRQAFAQLPFHAKQDPQATLAEITAYHVQMNNAYAQVLALLNDMGSEITAVSSHRAALERDVERELLLPLAVAAGLSALALAVLFSLEAMVPARLTGGIRHLSQIIDELAAGTRRSPIGTSGVRDFLLVEQSMERLRLAVDETQQRLSPTRHGDVGLPPASEPESSTARNRPR